MSNEKIFRALSSSTRIKILKKLSQNQMHVSGLARNIGISVPVTSKHIKILEEADLIDKKIFGNTYILSIKLKNFENILEPFIQESSIEINKEEKLFDALKQIPGIETKKTGKHQYIKSIDGEKGFYIYEVDGNLPNKPVDEYKINKNITIDLKKLISVNKKKIKVKIKKKNSS